MGVCLNPREGVAPPCEVTNVGRDVGSRVLRRGQIGCATEREADVVGNIGKAKRCSRDAVGV